MSVITIDPLGELPPEPDWHFELPGRSAAVQDERVAASHLWGVAIRELRGTDKFALANLHSVKRLVLAWLTYDRAARAVLRYGPVVKAPKTRTPMHSPWWSVMVQAAKMASQLEAELTVSPRSRNDGGAVPTPPRPASPSDRFLSNRSK